MVWACLLAGGSIGAFVAYAVVAAWARDWSAFWGVVIAVASIVAVGWVALHFNT